MSPTSMNFGVGEMRALCWDSIPTQSVRHMQYDFSEEAIPERDPSYRPFDPSLYDSPTIEVMPAEMRRALARRLEQLGMNRTRAALIASL